MRKLILAAVLILPLHAEMFDLQFERLAIALAGLSTPDRSVVDDAVALIRKGENNLALAKLSALNKQSPKNSSLRILTAYTLLRAGDTVGALESSGIALKLTETVPVLLFPARSYARAIRRWVPLEKLSVLSDAW